MVFWMCSGQKAEEFALQLGSHVYSLGTIPLVYWQSFCLRKQKVMSTDTGIISLCSILQLCMLLKKLKKFMSHFPGRNQDCSSTHRGSLGQESLNCHWGSSAWRCTALGGKEDAAIGCTLMCISWNTHKFPLSTSKPSVTALCANVGHLEKSKENDMNDMKSKKIS